MKKIISYFALGAALSMAVSCDEYDDRYSPEYASVVRLEQYGEYEMTAWTINDSEKFDIRVLRSGHNINTSTTATVRVMTDDEWTSYAATYGLKRYYKIPDDCFRFTDDAFDKAIIDFAPKQISGDVSVTIISSRLSSFSNSLPASETGEDNIICLPVVLETSNGSVLDAQSTLLLKVTSKDASLSISSTGFEKISCLSTSNPIIREYNVALSCDNPWGFSVQLENSAELIETYNAANGTRYTLMGASAVEVLDNEQWKPWADTQLDFPAGTTSKTVTVRISPANVGMMDAFALRVAQPTINIKTDESLLSNIIAVQVKPSTQRIKIPADNIKASTDDGKHTAKNLVDGKRNTYYTSNPEIHDGDPVYGSFVDITLPNPVRYFAFDYMSRFDYFGDGSGIPNEVDIYVSDDGATWEMCGNIRKMRSDFNNMSQTMTYGNFDAGREVKYIRWAVVRGGASGLVDHRENNTTAYWSATALYIFGK